MRLDEMAEDPVNESPLTPVGRPVCMIVMIVRGKVKAGAPNLWHELRESDTLRQTREVSWRKTALQQTGMLHAWVILRHLRVALKSGDTQGRF